MSDKEINPAFYIERGHESAVPEGIGRTVVSYGPTNQALFDKMLPFRAEFVEKMGWLTGKDQDGDLDSYDYMPETLHFCLTDKESEQVIAGLRLTQIPSVERSLSWKMFLRNDAMRNQAYGKVDRRGAPLIDQLNEAGETGHLWDLTRLVNEVDDNVDHMRIAAAMMELFGTGYGVIRNKTPRHEWDQIRWIFTGTELIKYALDALGVQHTVLADGMINEGDQSKSYFCMVRAEEATRYIYAHADERQFLFPHEHLDNGLRKANAL